AAAGGDSGIADPCLDVAAERDDRDAGADARATDRRRAGEAGELRALRGAYLHRVACHDGGAIADLCRDAGLGRILHDGLRLAARAVVVQPLGCLAGNDRLLVRALVGFRAGAGILVAVERARELAGLGLCVLRTAIGGRSSQLVVGARGLRLVEQDVRLLIALVPRIAVVGAIRP